MPVVSEAWPFFCLFDACLNEDGVKCMLKWFPGGGYKLELCDDN